MTQLTGVYPKQNPDDKVYYAKKLNYAFSMFVLDAEGKKIQMKNEATGLPLSNGRGEPVFYEESIRFTPWKTRFTEEGYVSVYVVTKDTPKPIAESLKNDAESRLCEIMDEATYIKGINPDLYAQMQRDAARTAELGQVKTENDDLKKELAEMRARLQKKQ